MTPTTTLYAITGLCLATPTLAAVPEAMTLIPEGTDAMIVMPDVGEFLRDADAFNTILGENGSVELTLATALVRGMPGLDLARSGAVALEYDPRDPEADPDFVAIVPVSDLGALTQGRRASDGLYELRMGAGSIYIRELGAGYAAIGPDMGFVRGFDGAGRAEDELGTMLGTAGVRIADSNDVFVFVDMDALRPMLEGALVEFEAQSDMIELMAGPEVSMSLDAMLSLSETAIEEGRAILHGMNFDRETGLSVDFALQFDDESETASKLNNNGHADRLMRRIPPMDFFAAWSFDFSGAGMRSLLEDYGEMVRGLDTTGMGDTVDFGDFMTFYEGGAMVIGASDMMMMNGILANTVFYGTNGDPRAGIDKFRELYDAAGGVEQPGISFEASVSDEPVAVAGVRAYEHAMRVNMDPDAGGGFGGPNPAMMMQMMYGPTLGPNGYIAPVEGGLVMTMSKSEDLLARAVHAAQGKDGVKEDPVIASVSSMLPENRVIEGYISTQHVLNAVGPMAMMFGFIPEFEPLGAMAPVAFGATADGGALMVRAVIPSPTLSTIMEMMPRNMGAVLMPGAVAPAGEMDEDDDEDIQF